MVRATNLSVKRFRRKFNGGIAVSEDSAGIGVELSAPTIILSAQFCKRSSLDNWV